MPLFYGDFLASTLTWTGPERGLYLQLLATQWSTGDLPADLQRLARAVNYEWAEFQALWPIMESKFSNGSGRLSNPRLEQHRERNTEIRTARSVAGKAGAEARWQKDSKRIGKANGKSNGKANSKKMPSDPIRSDPDPDPIRTETMNKKKAKTLDRRAVRAERDEAPFGLLQAIYPKRSGGQRWKDARSSINARLSEGHTWQTIIDAAQRYADWCAETGKIGTEKVKQAATFVGDPENFTLDWSKPLNSAEVMTNSNIAASQEWLTKKRGDS